jgi:hypothetical protein
MHLSPMCCSNPGLCLASSAPTRTSVGFDSWVRQIEWNVRRQYGDMGEKIKIKIEFVALGLLGLPRPSGLTETARPDSGLTGEAVEGPDPRPPQCHDYYALVAVQSVKAST